MRNRCTRCPMADGRSRYAGLSQQQHQHKLFVVYTTLTPTCMGSIWCDIICRHITSTIDPSSLLLSLCTWRRNRWEPQHYHNNNKNNKPITLLKLFRIYSARLQTQTYTVYLWDSNTVHIVVVPTRTTLLHFNDMTWDDMTQHKHRPRKSSHVEHESKTMAMAMNKRHMIFYY